MAAKEGRMQYECVKWYRNEWCKNPKRLWATFNEGRDVATKISMGLLPGVSDLILKDYRGMGGLEAKYPGETHTVDHLITQAKWIIETCDFGGFFDTTEQFKAIVQGKSAWYDPKVVLRYLESLKVKSIVWDGSKFL